MAAQECTRAMGEEHCIFHPKEKLAFECEECGGVLTCMICVGTVHQSHKLVTINQTVENKLVKIEQFIKQTKENAVPAVEEKIQMTIRTLKENEVKFKKEIQKVKKQENRLKELVERYSGTKVLKLEHLLKDTTDLLKGHKGCLENLKHKMKKDTQEYEQTVKTGLDHGVLVHDTEKQIVQRYATVSFPNIPSVTPPPNFMPCEDPNQYIEMAFGDLNEHTGETVEKKTTQSLSEYKFLDQPKILYESPTSYEVECNSICSTTNNNTWSFDIKGKLHLHDHDGKEQQTLIPDILLERICTHPTSGDMFGVSKSDKSIRRVCTQTGRTSVMFYLKSTPINIGCTNDNHFVVYMADYTIRKVSFTGQVLHTYKYTETYIPEISVCRNTSKVALTGHRYEGVTVLDHTLQQLYKYKEQSYKSLLKALFLINERCTTAAFLGRYLLVADRINRKIVVLDNDTLVHTFSMNALLHTQVDALSVQQDGVLHVGCSNPNKRLCIKLFE